MIKTEFGRVGKLNLNFDCENGIVWSDGVAMTMGEAEKVNNEFVIFEIVICGFFCGVYRNDE